MTTDRLLTPAEVAAELRIDKRSIYALLREGTLPHIDLGHRTKRIKRSALDQYLSDREAGTCS
jgi:excisionase family DNA binding protein